jgi:hypothetical protein
MLQSAALPGGYLRCKAAFVLNDNYRGSIRVAASIDVSLEAPTQAAGLPCSAVKRLEQSWRGANHRVGCEEVAVDSA